MESLDQHIHIKDLNIQFGSKQILSNVNLDLESNKIYALIGPNGSGKTSLLNTISGKLNFTGVIEINERKIESYDSRDLAQTISFLPSHNPNVAIKVNELIQMGRYPYTNFIGKLKEEDQKIITNKIELTGIENLVEQEFGNLSDGEKKKVMITTALIQDCDILLMDEPTNFLDIGNKYQFSLLLKKIRADLGKTILISTHDMNLAFQVADELLLIQENKIVKKTPDQAIKDKSLEIVFGEYGVKMDEKGELNFD